MNDNNNMVDYKDVVYKIIGAAMEVHNVLGFGLLEPVYQEALALELNSRGIQCDREVEISTYYKGQLMSKKYKMDMLVDNVIVELKAVESISSEQRMQLFNYMRLTKKPVGLLINFGEEVLHGERYCYDEESNVCYRVDKNMNPVL